MLYQLPTGKVIEISTEQFLDMSDEELEYLIAYNYGDVLENPWFGSVLNSRESANQEETPDITPDLINIPNEDKINCSDIDYKLEEE
jgi:hypothetical protein